VMPAPRARFHPCGVCTNSMPFSWWSMVSLGRSIQSVDYDIEFRRHRQNRSAEGRCPGHVRATSFVGVVHVIHYPAGKAADEVDLAYGNYGSVRGSASLVLPQIGGYQQSLSMEGQTLSFADSREHVTMDARCIAARSLGVRGLCMSMPT